MNCAQFWPELQGGLQELLRVVRAGGRAVIAVQPMKRGATEEDSERWRGKLVDSARSAGWGVEKSVLGPTRPPVAAVVLKKHAA